MEPVFWLPDPAQSAVALLGPVQIAAAVPPGGTEVSAAPEVVLDRMCPPNVRLHVVVATVFALPVFVRIKLQTSGPFGLVPVHEVTLA
jgi:hypothetical protein